MITERDLDCGAIYAEVRVRLMAAAVTWSPEQLATPVPASPAWSARDVLGHVVGLTADLNAQRFDIVDGDAFTARQVAERADRSVEELRDEWEAEAPKFEDGLRMLYEFGSHFVGDLLQHVQDINTALGLEPLRDDAGLRVGLDFYVDLLHQRLTERSVAVELGVADEAWKLGTGDVVATLHAVRFEAFRALGSRRTADEIRTLAWTGDVDGVLPVIGAYPLPTASVGP